MEIAFGLANLDAEKHLHSPTYGLVTLSTASYSSKHQLLSPSSHPASYLISTPPRCRPEHEQANSKRRSEEAGLVNVGEMELC